MSYPFTKFYKNWCSSFCIILATSLIEIKKKKRSNVCVDAGALWLMCTENPQSNSQCFQGLSSIEALKASCPLQSLLVLKDSQHGFSICRQRIPKLSYISSLPTILCRLVSLFKAINCPPLSPSPSNSICLSKG